MTLVFNLVVAQIKCKLDIYNLQLCDHFHIPQALHKLEAGQYNMSQCVTMETEKMMPLPDTETYTDSEEDEQELKKEDEIEREEELNQVPSASSRDIQCEGGVDSAAEAPACQQADDSGEAGHLEEKTCLSGEDCAASSPETKLQESVERLKTLMETDTWRERHQTSGPQRDFVTD